MSQTRRLRREAARQQLQLRLRRALATGRTRRGTYPWWAFWSSPKRTIAVIASIGMALVIGLPALAPPAPSATPEPTPATISEPTPGPESKKRSAPPEMQLTQEATYSAAIRTSRGEVRVNLLSAEAPNAVNNFVSLANDRFYTDTPVATKSTAAQVYLGGLDAAGDEGPGYGIPAETTSSQPALGSVVMVDQGDGTLGSQFIIVLEDQPTVSGPYTVIGRVTVGLDVVRRLTPNDQILSVNITEAPPAGG